MCTQDANADRSLRLPAGLQPRIFPALYTPIHRSIPPTPSPDTSPRIFTEFARYVSREHALPLGARVLRLHHIPRLQRAAVPAPHGVIAPTDPCAQHLVVGKPNRWLGNCWTGWRSGRTVLGNLTEVLKRILPADASQKLDVCPTGRADTVAQPRRV